MFAGELGEAFAACNEACDEQCQAEQEEDVDRSDVLKGKTC